MEDVKEERRNFLPVSELGISAPGEFAFSWESKWVGITAMKIEKKKTQTFPTPSKSHSLEMSQILRNYWRFMCKLMVFTVWFSTWRNGSSSGTSEHGVTCCFFGWAGGEKVSAGHKFLCRKNGLWHAEYYIFSCMYLLMDMRRPSTPTFWPLESS